MAGKVRMEEHEVACHISADEEAERGILAVSLFTFYLDDTLPVLRAELQLSMATPSQTVRGPSNPDSGQWISCHNKASQNGPSTFSPMLNFRDLL